MFAEKRIVFFFLCSISIVTPPQKKGDFQAFLLGSNFWGLLLKLQIAKSLKLRSVGDELVMVLMVFFFIPYVRPDFSRGDFWWQMGGGKRLTSLDSRDRFSLSRVRDKPYDGAHKDVFLVSLSLWKVSDWTCRMHRITSNHLIAKGCKGRLVSVTSKKGNYLTMLTSFKVLSLLLYGLTENEYLIHDTLTQTPNK